jgi:predicted house-cleaning noncanonical NTP pyrophosphatase (MazG superfamily)
MSSKVVEEIKENLDPRICEFLQNTNIEELLSLWSILEAMRADKGLRIPDYHNLMSAIDEYEKEYSAQFE